MGIGRVLGAAAPIAAGYFTGGAGAGFLGLQGTSAALAAGALTGAGIAALSGNDPLTGGITGALGGMSGGAMSTAAQATKLAEASKLAQAGAPTGAVNSTLYSTSPFTSPSIDPKTMAFAEGKAPFIPSNYTAPSAITGPQPLAQSIQAGQGPNMGFRSLSTDVAGGGGYQSIGDTLAQGVESGQAAVRNPGEFLSQLGKGSKAMGAGRLGLTGLGVAGQAGAFDPDPDMPKYGDDPRTKYDPTRRLNLDAIDTGLTLNRDTGLRLLAQGGQVKKYAEGDKVVRDQSYYGINPKYQTSTSYSGPYGMMGGGTQSRTRVPVMGYVDVGGKFVADPKGTMSDIDYEERFKYVTEGVAKSGDESGGDFEARAGLQGARGAGISPAVALQAAQGYAKSQQSNLDEQGLGLQSLKAGGQIKHYIGGGVVGAALGRLGNNTLPGGMGGVIGAVPGGLGQTYANPILFNMGLAKLPQSMSGTPAPTEPTALTTALNLNTGKQEPIKAYEQGNFEAGGYLETGGEVGDGMSDEIEATIEGSQEARLSDGEFVIPADVVSHLGNGSSDAGARRLYEMMDKVRMARTGTKKQGKEINPERYMPA